MGKATPVRQLSIIPPLRPNVTWSSIQYKSHARRLTSTERDTPNRIAVKASATARLV